MMLLDDLNHFERRERSRVQCARLIQMAGTGLQDTDAIVALLVMAIHDENDRRQLLGLLVPQTKRIH